MIQINETELKLREEKLKKLEYLVNVKLKYYLIFDYFVMGLVIVFFIGSFLLQGKLQSECYTTQQRLLLGIPKEWKLKGNETTIPINLTGLHEP